MPLPIITDVFRVALEYSASGGQTAANVIHVLTDGTEDAVDVWDTVINSFTANCFLSMSNDWTMDHIKVTPLDGSGATYEGAGYATIGASGEYVPQVSPVVHLSTSTRGRSYRGRIFLPGTREGVITNGYLNSDTRSSMNAAWVSFKTALEGATPTEALVVASYKLSTAHLVTATDVRRKLGTQRRRQSRLA